MFSKVATFSSAESLARGACWGGGGAFEIHCAWKEIKKRRELYLAICEQAFGDTEGEPSAKMITL